MILKESKNGNSRKKTAIDISELEKSSKTLRGKKENSLETNPNSMLDPQLSLQQTPSRVLGNAKQPGPAYDAALRHRSHIPRMQLWPTPTRPRSKPLGCIFSGPPSKAKLDDTPDIADTPSNTDYLDSLTDSPVMSNYPDPPTAVDQLLLAGSKRRSSTTGYENDETEVDPMTDDHLPDMEDDEVGGNSKLKGVYWPGMAIFDSASPDAKRKRNQKKDGSILEQMEHNAAIVEPIELIFTPHGELKKMRTISGRVEDSSPIKEETPKPKRRCSKPKAPVLSELSTNNPRNGRGKRAIKATIRQSRPHHSDLGNLSKRALAALDSSPAISTGTEGGHFIPTEDEQAEWRLTFGDPRRDRKRGVVVYDDNTNDQPRMPAHIPVSDGRLQAYPVLQQAGYNHHGLAHTHGMPLLTSGFHLSANMIGHSNAESIGTHKGPNVAYHRAVPAFWGNKDSKENIEPVLDHIGRIDNGAASVNTERRTQRYFSVEGSHTPQFFHTLPSHMEFGAFQDSEFYGHSFNPLTLNFQQQASTAYRHSSPPFTRRQPRAAVGPLLRTTKTEAIGSSGHGHLREDAGEATEDDGERMFFDAEGGWSS